MNTGTYIVSIIAAMLLAVTLGGFSQAQHVTDNIYPVPELKPRDSTPVLAVGDAAPDFTLPSLSDEKITLSDYRGKKNVVISFVPAAWTPVCSDQWPGYNLAKDIFEKYDAVMLGITVDNIPSLYSWCQQMSEEGGVWFPVLSDFFPHGEIAKKYGVLRSEGIPERALFVIDKKGVIRYIDIHDINVRPPLDDLVEALAEIEKD